MFDVLRQRLEGHVLYVVAYLCLIALALWTRFAWTDWVFVGDHVLPSDGDAALHLRRIIETVRDPHYPNLFDPLTNWPHGETSMWSPGFDWLGVGLVYLFGAAGDPDMAPAVAVTLPVWLGVLTVIATVSLVRTLLPDRRYTALGAGFVCAMIPQCVSVGMIGRTDHHVAELLSVALLMSWSLRARALHEEGTHRDRVWFEVRGALLSTGSIWVLSIALINVGFAVAVLATTQLLLDSRPRRLSSLVGTGAPGLLGGCVVLLLLYIPVVQETGIAVNYSRPSYLQPVLLLVGAIAIALAVASGWRVQGAPSLKRVLQRAGLTAFGVGLALMLFSTLGGSATRELTSGLVDYMGVQNEWLARNIELLPLFHDGQYWRLDGFFSTAGWLAPISLPVAAFATYRRNRVTGLLFLFWMLPLFALGLAQMRWSRPLGVPLAVVTAIFISELVRFVLTRVKLSTSPRIAEAVTLGLALLVAVGRGTDLLRHPPPGLPRYFNINSAAIFLKDYARPVEPGNHSGVLVRWYFAQHVLAVAERPIISGGFGPFVGLDGFIAERDVWKKDQFALTELMDAYDLGYVVAGADTFSDQRLDGDMQALNFYGDRPTEVNEAYFRRAPLAALILGGSALPALDVPHVERLCPVWAGPEYVRGIDFPVPSLWVYEHVEGARLTGTAPSGTRVIAESYLRHAQGVVRYHAYADAGDDGSFEIRYPIPTRMKQQMLQSGKNVRINRMGLDTVRVDVPEAAVREGLEIHVP